LADKRQIKKIISLRTLRLCGEYPADHIRYLGKTAPLSALDTSLA
jgi:hypothetical protein